MSGAVLISYGGGGGGGTPTDLSATATPTDVIWVSSGPSYWDSNSSIVIYATGGSGVYGYSWEALPGSEFIYFTAINADTTSLISSVNTPGTFRGLVTDALTGASTYTNNVSVVP